MAILPFSGGESGKWSSLSNTVFHCLRLGRNNMHVEGPGPFCCLRGTHGNRPGQLAFFVCKSPSFLLLLLILMLLLWFFILLLFAVNAPYPALDLCL